MSYVLISHRGNINCSYNKYENHPSYIQNAIDLGYDVEIDVRKVNDQLFLGHDNPDYEISINWLLDRSLNLWVHTKNFECLSYLIDFKLKIFYHQKENHTIINNCNLIWSHNLRDANEKSIIPLLSLEDIKNFNNNKVYGICSDFISVMKEK